MINLYFICILLYFYNMKKKRKVGGGRKKLPPELVKQVITVFVEKKFVDAAGGAESLKEFLYDQAIKIKPHNSPS